MDKSGTHQYLSRISPLWIQVGIRTSKNLILLVQLVNNFRYFDIGS